jgi:hypothetical protein
MGQGGDVLAPIRFAKNVEVPGRQFQKLQNDFKIKISNNYQRYLKICLDGKEAKARMTNR